MQGYGLKMDTRRRDLLTPDEDVGYRQALALLTAEKALAEVEPREQEV